MHNSTHNHDMVLKCDFGRGMMGAEFDCECTAGKSFFEHRGDTACQVICGTAKLVCNES